MDPETLKLLSEPVKPEDLTKLRKCLCDKLLSEKEFSVTWYSGVVNYSETLCTDCRRDRADYARIVCLGCKSLQGFVTPGKADTGFEFKRRHHYHIALCPRCRPEIFATPVLEHDEWCRGRGIMTKSNMDLLQEIEQKTLAGVAETDKVRRELNPDKP